jgi:hypothetical protein
MKQYFSDSGERVDESADESDNENKAMTALR